jgi:hypothetical protein
MLGKQNIEISLTVYRIFVTYIGLTQREWEMHDSNIAEFR